MNGRSAASTIFCVMKHGMNRPRPRLHRTVGSLARPRAGLRLRAEQRAQRRGLDGLRQVMVEAGFVRLPAIAFLAPACDGDEKDPISAVTLANQARELVTIE